MANDREKISTGPNAEPLNESIGTIAEGFPDEGPAPGEKELPRVPSEREVADGAESLGAPDAEVDTLPLDGE